MGVAADEDVAVELSLHCSQCLKITPWENLMSVNDSNLEVADLNNLRLWQVAKIFIEITLHDVSLALRRSKVLEPFNCL